MIKLGEKRINPGHVIRYYPGTDTYTDTYIEFELSSGKLEKIVYDSKEERDGMLNMLDKYLVSFDNGTITVPDLGGMPTFILNGPEQEEGPGGVSMQ